MTTTTTEKNARYTTQIGRAAHSARPGRESLRKRLGKLVVAVIEARDGNACVYCGATAESSGTHLHLDHLSPKSKGGLDTVTNLVLACRSCNCRRQDKSLLEWERVSKPLLSFSARKIRNHAKRVSA